MNKVDITYSVMIDNAVCEYQQTTKKIMSQFGLSIDMVEIALEKTLMELKNEKMKLYATAMYDSMLRMQENNKKQE